MLKFLLCFQPKGPRKYCQSFGLICLAYILSQLKKYISENEMFKCIQFLTILYYALTIEIETYICYHPLLKNQDYLTRSHKQDA